MSEILAVFQFFGCVLLILFSAIVAGDFAGWLIVETVAWFDRRKQRKANARSEANYFSGIRRNT